MEIVAEGREDLLQALIHGIDIVRYPIEVTSCNVTWQEATGEFPKFTIIRGDVREELFERIDSVVTIMHETLEVSKSTRDLQYQTLDKQDQMLHKHDQMIDKQDQMLDKQDQMIDKQDQMLDKQDQMIDKQDQMLDKQDQMIDKQDQMLDKQDQMIEIGKETRDEITFLRKDTRSYLNDEFKEIRKELTSIKDALIRAGIQV